MKKKTGVKSGNASGHCMRPSSRVTVPLRAMYCNLTFNTFFSMEIYISTKVSFLVTYCFFFSCRVVNRSMGLAPQAQVVNVPDPGLFSLPLLSPPLLSLSSSLSSHTPNIRPSFQPPFFLLICIDCSPSLSPRSFHLRASPQIR